MTSRDQALIYFHYVFIIHVHCRYEGSQHVSQALIIPRGLFWIQFGWSAKFVVCWRHTIHFKLFVRLNLGWLIGVWQAYGLAEFWPLNRVGESEDGNVIEAPAVDIVGMANDLIHVGRLDIAAGLCQVQGHYQRSFWKVMKSLIQSYWVRFLSLGNWVKEGCPESIHSEQFK